MLYICKLQNHKFALDKVFGNKNGNNFLNLFILTLYLSTFYNIIYRT